MCLLSHSQLQKVAPKHPLIFLDISLYYSSNGRPEPYFCLALKKNNKKKKGQSLFLLKVLLIQTLSRRQQMNAAASCRVLKQLICRNPILFLDGIHTPYSHIDWPVVNSGFSNDCLFKDFSIYQHFKTKGFQNLTHCPVSLTHSPMPDRFAKKPSSLNLCTHRAMQTAYSNTRIGFSWSVFDCKIN